METTTKTPGSPSSPGPSDQLSRFTNSGKTFFLNAKTARNGTTYLAINAIYGQNRHEKLVLLPAQYMQFLQHVRQAIERLTGFSFQQPAVEPQLLPNRCPNCSWHLTDPSKNQ